MSSFFGEAGAAAVLVSILLSTFRVSVPLVFAAMGGVMSERSGVINIALEGLMLVGAFAAATGASFTHSPWMGALFGVLAGVALAAVYALFVIQFRADQIVAGTAINLFAFGVTPLLTKAFFDSTGATPSLALADRFGNQPLYLALVVVIGIAFWFRHSRLGLWLGFAGEHPEALSTAGIRVRTIRWFGVLAAGALAGMGGATLSIFLSSSFSRGMTAGRGFMALAALIFGKWRPIPTLFACLFFGLTDAVQIRLQGVPVFGGAPIPVQFIQILPYVFTVLVLAGFMGKSRPPRALGSPWLGVLLVGAFFLAPGCDFQAWKAKVGLDQSSPPVSRVAPVATDDLRSPVARKSRENGELLAEIIRVVFGHAPKNPAVFADYRASLNQGASLEGILNGLVHSTAYREFETTAPRASVAARAFFVDELVRLQEGLVSSGHDPIAFTDATPLPLAKIEIPTGAPDSGKLPETVWKYQRKTSPATYAKAFANSSTPILRRVFIEAVEARIDGFPSATSPEFGTWYSDLAARLAGAGVDFGLPQRNLASVDYHREMFRALVKSRTAGEVRDRILWESLNRYLRILNQLDRSDKVDVKEGVR
jgi:simple sugar transport system permease protein